MTTELPATEKTLTELQLTPQETARILRRIAEHLEESRRNRWLEVASAVVLALATTASTWCAYQSIRWSGVQTFRLAAAARAGREASQHSLRALQIRAFDAQVLIPWIEAKSRGDDKLAQFLHDRFRPEAQRALDAWLKTDPFNNPEAPKRPFELKEYVQPDLQEARRLEAEAATEHAAAQHANETSDTYVLLTVLFAAVLFFGGIGGTFQSGRLRLAVFNAAVILLLATIVFVATMPICHE